MSSVVKIVECVPNFSDGRNQDVLDALADAIRNSEGCSLLDVESGVSTNRSVFTFCGSPSAVVEGALQAARTARKLIDMTKHHGMVKCCGTIPSYCSSHFLKCSIQYYNLMIGFSGVVVFLLSG